MGALVNWKRLGAVMIFLALLAPAAWFAWRNRDMPQLGRYHDDAIFLTVAKSLAEGTGYRIQNLPDAPYETKYPPVIVWLLAVIWKLNPRFPENLQWVTALQFAMIPPFLMLTWRWLREAGCSRRAQWAGVVLLALSPYTVVFAAGIYTEILFTFLFLAAMLLLHSGLEGERPWGWTAVAGALAGLAFLTRSAGIVALVSTPLVLLLWKRRRDALVFFSSMFPFVAAWMIWVRLNKPAPVDVAVLYNTDYLGFFLLELSFKDLGTITWTNLSFFLDAMGALPFPWEAGGGLLSVALNMLRTTAAIGMLHGLWLARRNRAVQMYSAFAGLTAVELIVWNFPPDLRLMYPLVPLLVAGVMYEGRHLLGMIRSAEAHRVATQRNAAWVVRAVTASLALTAVWMHWEMTGPGLVARNRNDRAIRQDSIGAFEWIAEHSDPVANVLCWNPALYLYTGRRTQSLFQLPVYWYRGDTQQLMAPVRDLPRGQAARPMQYFYVHEADYGQLASGQGPEVQRSIESNPALKAVYRRGGGTVYQLTQTN